MCGIVGSHGCLLNVGLISYRCGAQQGPCLLTVSQGRDGVCFIFERSTFVSMEGKLIDISDLSFGFLTFI